MGLFPMSFEALKENEVHFFAAVLCVGIWGFISCYCGYYYLLVLFISVVLLNPTHY